jgi:hypothetical protein
MTRWSTVFVVGALFALACAAQDVPPPPKLPDDSPSLETTMKFIEEKLGSIGPVSYIVNTGGDEWKETDEVTNVRTNVAGCRIDYDSRATSYGKVNQTQNISVPLKDVEEVLVKSMEQDRKEFTSKAGHPEWTVQVSPPVFVLTVKRKSGGNNFYMYDESLANRIAKALVHAVELCGGGSKDPF